MSCLSPARAAELKAELAKKKAQLLKLETAYDAGSIEIEAFTFDSGEARQSSKFRSLKELGEQIDRFESQIRRISGKLNGTGLMNMNLRRRTY